MANQPQRPPVRVRFRYNVDSGEIEEFVVDDNAPDRSEDYHDKMAQAFAGRLGRHPDIEEHVEGVEVAPISDRGRTETGTGSRTSEESEQPLEE